MTQDNPSEILSLALQHPEDTANWDAVDDLARAADSPDNAEATYGAALSRGELTGDGARAFGQRYVEFLEEWYEETDKPIAVLHTLVSADVGNGWAIEKLSLLLTLSERWNELLGVYDDCLGRSSDGQQVESLLEEAARIAKDFAGQAQRASDYLKRLFLLRPRDEQLALVLERRLAEQERHQDLVDVWHARLPHVNAATQLDLRVRITERYLNALNASDAALTGSLELLTLKDGKAPGCALLEQLAAQHTAPHGVRTAALEALKKTYAQDDRCDDVIRILEAYRALATTPETNIALNRELVTWHLRNNSPEEAQRASAVWLLLAPDDDDALAELQALAKSTANFSAFSQALEDAASQAEGAERRIHLTLLAAKTEHHETENHAAAVQLYDRALSADDASQEQQLTAARALRALLTSEQQAQQRLDVLDRLWQLESKIETQRDALVEAAQLAEKLSDDERALSLWRQCLALDEADSLALDAQVAILARGRRFHDLLGALRARFQHGTNDEMRRSDLIWSAHLHELQLAQPDQAIALWNEIEATFGRTNDTTDALANLYEQNRRWPELIDLLQTAEKSETLVARRTLQLTSLGDVFRLHRNEPALAAIAYGQALELNPRHDGARDGLLALLESPDVRKEAAEILTRAYRTADEWEGTLGLVETRYSATETVSERQEVLLEAAKLAEVRKEDAVLALDFLGRAFSLIPAPSVEEEMLRLAASSNQWHSAIDGYARALRHCSDTERTIQLLLEQGRVFEVQLDQWSEALDAYKRVVELGPGHVEGVCAVIRSASRLGNWDVAAWAVVEHARAAGTWQTDVIEGFRQNAIDVWHPALSALDAKIAQTELEAQTSHDLKFQLARFYEQQLGATTEAVRVLSQAVDEYRTAPSLEMLIELQRRSPSAALVSNLLKLADIVEQPLPQLDEAARVALTTENNPSLARPILERSLATAEQQLSYAADGSSRANNAEEVGVWSLEELVKIATVREEYETAFELLQRAAKLPVSQEQKEAFLHRAATTASEYLKRIDRAVELCRRILEQNPLRLSTIDLLASLYETEKEYTALIRLRQDELGRTKDAQRKLNLRLDVARVSGIISLGQAAQLAPLLANLKERPGHSETIGAVCQLLTDGKSFAELYEIYTQQAELLGADQEEAAASDLYIRAGNLAHSDLGDEEKALTAYRASVSLNPNVAALDALADIHTSRGEFTDATAWLKQRLELTPATELAARQNTLVKLGKALRAADRIEESIGYLSSGLQEEPSWTHVRELLAQLREARGEWLEFATLLGEGVAFAQDIPTKVHYLKRAATVWWHDLNELLRAIPLLQRAYELVPDDQALRLQLAEGLRLAGRLQPARGLLESLLSEFGRRRTPERANVHYQLALIERAEGNLEPALEQLDAASKIQRTDPVILKTLGDVAQQKGELERAETAYRALLLLIGRKQAETTAGGESAILFELYRIAVQRQDAARAKDLLDSALQAADQDGGEALRLEEALKQAGHWDLLLGSLQRRLSRTSDAQERIEILRARAEALIALGRNDDALDILFELVASNPTEASLLDQTEQFSRAAGQEPRFAETCLKLATGLEAAGDNVGACELWLRLGRGASERGNLAQAANYFERAQATGVQPQMAFVALRSVLEVTGDVHGLTLALERYVAADPSELDPADLTEALFRLAEHHLCGKERALGIEHLGRALAREADYPRAAEILETASEISPPTAAMTELLTDVAQRLGNHELTVRATLWGANHVPLAQLSAVAEFAVESGDTGNATRLLSTLVERARSTNDDDVLLPSLIKLSTIRQAEAQFELVHQLLTEASELASGDEKVDLLLRIAELDWLHLNRRTEAVSLLEELRDQRKHDSRIWKPLLSLYRALGEHDKLLACLSDAEQHAERNDERRALRLERIRLMVDAGQDGEAEKSLRDALDEDANNGEAAELLLELLERGQRHRDLQTLLQQLLEYAITNGATANIERYALKLGALHENGNDIEAAVGTYRAAHAAVRNNRGVLLALLPHVPESEAYERADLYESLLPTEPAEGVEEMSLMLASLREQQSDESGVERAYELGYKRNPDSATLRDRLLEWYRVREQWSPLAELLATCALREVDGEQMVATLQEAAAIYDERLGDAAGAADVLVRGLDREPMSLGLLEPACEYLVTAGRPDEAMTLLDTTLADERHSDESLALVYHLRAAVRARADEHNLEAIIDAIADLEMAGTIGGTDLVEDLATLLMRQQQLAERQGQENAEQDALVRLSQLLPGLNQNAELLAMLQSFCGRYPHNITLRAKWAEVAFDEANWGAAVQAYSELIPLLQGEAQIPAVLRLTHAAIQGGSPLLAKQELERLSVANPEDESLSVALRQMYQAAGAHDELAQMLLHRANATTNQETRFALLRDAGELFLASAEPHPQTIPTLQTALELAPGDHRTTLALAKAHTRLDAVGPACAVLENAIKNHGKKRSLELSELQYAMSEVAKAAGDYEGQLAWLDAAMQSDRRNGAYASELAVLAMERDDLEMATKALQLVTLLKEDGPMSRAEAYLRQATIAVRKGDDRKAVLLAKRAMSADPNYEPARKFVEKHS
jgi:tetratricopeptide (TPR) repeat protein